ncbi:MAG: hypothetical protein U1F77_04130 [Kiritimatiellia bacterium]
MEVPGHACSVGWDAVAADLDRAIRDRGVTLVAVECYPGVDEESVAEELRTRLAPAAIIRTSRGYAPGGGDRPAGGAVSWAATIPSSAG